MVAEVLEAARSFRKLLSGFDVRLCSGADCASLADELAATEKACGAARLLAAARAADCGAHKERGFSDAATWVASQCGSNRSGARAELEAARRLESCADTKAAMLAGEVSLGQAAEIARAESEAPGAEAKLLSAARDGDLSRLRDKARQHIQGQTPPEELHLRQRRARSFRHWSDEIGMVCFRGALPPEVGVPIMARIDAEAQRLKRRARKAGSEEPFEAHGADAFAALVSGGGGAGGGAGGAGSGAGGEPKPRPAQAELVIVCDLFAWRRGHAHPGELCQIIGGGPIPVPVAKQLCEDAFLKVALHDGVNIHTVSHQGRHIPAELKTALDLGPVPEFTGRECADGCGRRFGLQYDHVNPVANGGPTSYDNLVGRCWEHHRAKTQRDRAAGLLGRHPPDTS